ncbi:MAG: NAD-dependent malic enzyme [Planctomycetota bacterium]|jgi:malate dehydrogenase (oxaloacetate-decarboxylating)
MRHSEDRTDPATDERYRLVNISGAELKSDPLLNKGSAFTEKEREMFALEGLLPPAVSTWAEQQERVYERYLRQTDPIAKYLELTALQDRNETLFYRVLIDHIDEMAPIVYTPTVGKACQQFSHLYRRPRGIYINLHQRGRIEQVLRNAHIDDCRVMVVTDNEAILGLGDLGVGGMGIPIGKLTLYTAGAGIHPATCLPVDLDVGTNNTDCLRDPLYLGIREPRARGDEYFSFLDEFAEAVKKVFPKALVQWEDFSNETAFAILRRYHDKLPSFDDDIQGTGAVIAAGVLAAGKRTNRPLKDERIVILGAGAAGGGVAFALRDALVDEGVPAKEAMANILCLDSRGLIRADRSGLRGHKAELATDPAMIAKWKGGPDGIFDLEQVVENFKATILIGTAGQPGLFTRSIVQQMAQNCDRPIIMPLSNPTSKAEATPEHIMRWTDGKAIIGTGSPFDPVTHDGKNYGIGQANNVLIFPGAGLGAIAVGAKAVPETAFLAAAKALTQFSDASPTAPLFPSLHALREVSHAVARAVGRELVDAGAAPECSPEEIDRRIADLIWDPAYLPYRNR